MTDLPIKKEWDFIRKEIIRHKPKSKFAKELISLLQVVLRRIPLEERVLQKTGLIKIYLMTKKQYLKLAN